MENNTKNLSPSLVLCFSILALTGSSCQKANQTFGNVKIKTVKDPTPGKLNIIADFTDPKIVKRGGAAPALPFKPIGLNPNKGGQKFLNPDGESSERKKTGKLDRNRYAGIMSFLSNASPEQLRGVPIGKKRSAEQLDNNNNTVAQEEKQGTAAPIVVQDIATTGAQTPPAPPPPPAIRNLPPPPSRKENIPESLASHRLKATVKVNQPIRPTYMGPELFKALERRRMQTIED